MDIDGDEFAECDYGLVVDNSQDTQKLNSQMESIGQAMAQNGMQFSALLKMYSSMSMQEKIRVIEKAEKQTQQQQQEAQQQQMQLEQQKIQAEQQAAMQKMQQEDTLNQRDNDTKIRVAEINAQAEYLRLGIYAEENDEQLVHEKYDLEREKLRAEIEQFDKELKSKDEDRKSKEKIELKKIEAQKQIAKSRGTSSSSTKK